MTNLVPIENAVAIERVEKGIFKDVRVALGFSGLYVKVARVDVGTVMAELETSETLECFVQSDVPSTLYIQEADEGEIAS